MDWVRSKSRLEPCSARYGLVLFRGIDGVYNSHHLPSFGHFQQVLGRFWTKRGWFLPQISHFEIEVLPLQCPFPAATVGFIAHTLCCCPSHPQVASTKILAGSQAPRWSCDVAHFARACCGCLVACYLPACLLLACCLLAKPVRSTLDTREGYNTKTGSSSLVTLTRIEYWDRADGGRNMLEET